MNFNILLITNVLLLVVNLLTVVGNIFLPRFLENPSVDIVSVTPFVDETEIVMSKSVAQVVSAVIEVRDDGDT